MFNQKICLNKKMFARNYNIVQCNFGKFISLQCTCTLNRIVSRERERETNYHLTQLFN